MNSYIEEALEHYDIKINKVEFIRHNENMTYKLFGQDKEYVLRIHKPVDGFSLGILQGDLGAFHYLESEMILIDYAYRNMETPIQKPVKNKSGEFVSCLCDGTPVSVLEWVSGNTLEKITITETMAQATGEMIARLHQCFKTLDVSSTHNRFSQTLKHDINRYAYDQDLLILIEKELYKTQIKGQIKKDKVDKMKTVLLLIKKRMDELDALEGMSGIIHADLSSSNVVFAENQLVPIDFSLSGYGHYYMDLGILISQYKDKRIRKRIKDGYEKIMRCEVAIPYIEGFFILGVLLFIACQHDKIHKLDWFEGALERWEKTLFDPFIHGINFVF